MKIINDTMECVSRREAGLVLLLRKFIYFSKHCMSWTVIPIMQQKIESFSSKKNFESDIVNVVEYTRDRLVPVRMSVMAALNSRFLSSLSYTSHS